MKVAIDLGHVECQINQSVGISPLIIVPRDQLGEVVVQRDTSINIQDGGSAIMDEITADHGIVSVSKDSLNKTTITKSLLN